MSGLSTVAYYFNPYVRTFLRTIRANVDIRGILTKGEEHKITAFADDVIFFVTSPLISLVSLLQELSTDGALSNFRMNYEKSEAMGVELGAVLQHQIASQYAFKYTDSHICYLRTKIPKKLHRIFELNFAPMMCQFK